MVKKQSNFWQSNVKFVRVTITEGDAEQIALDDEPVADVLYRITSFCVTHEYQFKIRRSEETLDFTASVYVDWKSDKLFGCLLQAKAPTWELALKALDFKLTVLDGKDWLSFIEVPNNSQWRIS